MLLIKLPYRFIILTTGFIEIVLNLHTQLLTIV